MQSVTEASLRQPAIPAAKWGPLPTTLPVKRQSDTAAYLAKPTMPAAVERLFSSAPEFEQFEIFTMFDWLSPTAQPTIPPQWHILNGSISMLRL